MSKDYVTKNGATVSGEWMDAVAMAADRDNLPGKAVMTVYHVGRPCIYEGEEMTTVSVRIPLSRLEAIDEAALEAGESRSQFIRDALDRALAIS